MRILRRIGIGLLVTLLAVIGLWIAALQLPDAPSGSSQPSMLTRIASVFHRQTRDVLLGTVLAVPIAGVARSALHDSWGDPRDNGLRVHHGTDIMAPGGTPIRAAAPGTVEKLFTSAAGGTTLYVRSPARNWTYYYAHLSAYAAGLHEGQGVRTGDLLGYVGDTGNAGAGNFHLHFGLTRTTPGQPWYQGVDVDPYPYLAGKPLPG